MGTRGLLGLIIAGQRYGAYNQYDCYPSGLGKDMLEFILNLTVEDWEKMAAMVKEIEWVVESAEVPLELQEKYTKLEYCNTKVGEGNASSWYCLLRNVQGSKALDEIFKGDLKHMIQKVQKVDLCSLQLSFLKTDCSASGPTSIDFENKKFETWAHGQFLEEASLEQLNEVDLDEYVEKLQALGEGSYGKHKEGKTDTEVVLEPVRGSS